jgi:hypothetical protein
VRHKKEVQDRLYQGLRERYIVVVEEPAPVRKTELAAKAAGVTSETVQ